MNEGFENTAQNVRSQYESLDVMNEEDFDVDNFIAHAVEEINKDWYFHSIRSSDSQRCFLS